MIFDTISHNPFEVPKYITYDLGELLDLLVMHHTKLNELNSNGHFRSRRYRRHRKNIEQIQQAIRAITETSSSSFSVEK